MLGSFDRVTSLCMGFCSERAAAGLGPSGLSEPCQGSNNKKGQIFESGNPAPGGTIAPMHML